MQYEGLEASPNIFYTGATTNQQIIPALDYLKEQGMTKLFLVGSDYVFPRTANKIIKAYAEANGMKIVGEEYLPLGDTDVRDDRHQGQGAEPDAVFNTLNGDSNVAFFKQLKAPAYTPRRCRSSRCRSPRRRSAASASRTSRATCAWNYYQTTDSAGEREVRRGLQGQVRRRPGRRPTRSRPATSRVYLWKAAVEKAGSFDVDDVKAAAKGITFDAPEGTVTVDGENQHISKTARIGVISADGLIDEVWNSGEPIEPDPYLKGYAWAEGLSCSGRTTAGRRRGPVRRGRHRTTMDVADPRAALHRAQPRRRSCCSSRSG